MATAAEIIAQTPDAEGNPTLEVVGPDFAGIAVERCWLSPLHDAAHGMLANNLVVRRFGGPTAGPTCFVLEASRLILATEVLDAWSNGPGDRFDLQVSTETGSSINNSLFVAAGVIVVRMGMHTSSGNRTSIVDGVELRAAALLVPLVLSQPSSLPRSEMRVLEHRFVSLVVTDENLVTFGDNWPAGFSADAGFIRPLQSDRSTERLCVYLEYHGLVIESFVIPSAMCSLPGIQSITPRGWLELRNLRTADTVVKIECRDHRAVLVDPPQASRPVVRSSPRRLVDLTGETDDRS